MPTLDEFLSNGLEQVHEDLACPICQQHSNDDKPLVRLPCHDTHIYHDECILVWLQQPHVNTCPSCRAVLFDLSEDDSDSDASESDSDLGPGEAEEVMDWDAMRAESEEFYDGYVSSDGYVSDDSASNYSDADLSDADDSSPDDSPDDSPADTTSDESSNSSPHDHQDDNASHDYSDDDSSGDYSDYGSDIQDDLDD